LGCVEETDRTGGADSMITQNERYKMKEFWELAEEIDMAEIPANNQSFFQRFFRKDNPSPEEE
jgi:hypothetical protein